MNVRKPWRVLAPSKQKKATSSIEEVNVQALATLADVALTDLIEERMRNWNIWTDRHFVSNPSA
jgi:hypothetical protein